MLDRARLSQKNDGWTDEQGHVFIFFPIKNLAEAMHKSEMSIKTALAALEKENILGGQKLDDHRILWCCTEMNTKEDMDLLVRIVKEV